MNISETEQRIAVQFKPEGFYTVRQFMELRKISRVRIYQLILAKKLEKTKVGKYTYIKLNGKENWNEKEKDKRKFRATSRHY